MGHVKELTLRVRANEKVVASVSLLGVIACTIIGAGYFAPKAEACSPPLDGSEFTCPSDDLIIKRPFEPLAKETETPDYYNSEVTVWDTREPQKWDTGSVIQGMRDWKAEQDRTPIDEMINASLLEYSEEHMQEE